MNESKNMIVDAKAGRALAQWEAIFSQQTVRLAKEIARQSDSKRVTVEHFQQAAEAAIVAGTMVKSGENPAATAA